MDVSECAADHVDVVAIVYLRQFGRRVPVNIVHSQGAWWEHHRAVRSISEPGVRAFLKGIYHHHLGPDRKCDVETYKSLPKPQWIRMTPKVRVCEELVKTIQPVRRDQGSQVLLCASG